MKKIIIVIDSLNIGGAEKSLVSLLNNIDLSKYQISLLILSLNHQLINQLPKEIEILPVPNLILNLYKPWFSDLSNIKLTLKRIAFAINNRINRHSNSTNNILYWKAFSPFFKNLHQTYHTAIGWGQGIPVLYIVEKIKAHKKIGWFNAEYPIEEKFRSQFHRYFKELTYVVAVSDVLANKLIFSHPFLETKIKIIYDIIDTKRILSLSDEKIPFVFPKEKIKILTIARLDKRKGLKLAIETALLLKEKINFVWYVIGEGEERKLLENKIRQYDLNDNFKILGSIENPYPYLKGCDIYVQTSLSEGFCLTLAEAKLFNLPIVTTDFPTAFNQIKNDITGFIVEKEPSAIEKKILKIIQEKDLAQIFVNNLSKEKKGNLEELNKLYDLI